MSAGWGSGRHHWTRTLSEEQRAHHREVLDRYNSNVRLDSSLQGWSLHMTPTTRTPTYIELRYRVHGRLVLAVKIWDRTGPVEKVLRSGGIEFDD